MSSQIFAVRNNLSNPSQLVLRNVAALPWTQLLVVNYPSDDLLLQLIARRPELAITAAGDDYAADAALRQRLRTAGHAIHIVHFGVTLPVASAPFDSALLFLPKSRPLLEMTLAQIGAVLPAGAPLWLVGENKAGIRSSLRTLSERIGPTHTVDSARHCLLLQAMLGKPQSAFVLNEWASSYSFDFHAVPVRVITLPGVFSHGRLDEGTRLLLTTLAERPQGAVLDWACGAGVIGVAVQTKWPAIPVDFADVSALALAASERTLAANGLTARKLIATDIFSAVTEQYALILANPPFHSGVATDYQMVTAFVQGARQQLVAGGKLRIVVQRFLKVQPLIEAHVGPCRVVAQDRGYVVYEAVRM